MNLPGLVRFIGSHFDDMDQLKGFLEKCELSSFTIHVAPFSDLVSMHVVSGNEIYEEHLSIFKLILDRFAKYLLLPGLDLEININGKVGQLWTLHDYRPHLLLNYLSLLQLVALNNEILISIETPDFSAQASPSSNMDSQPIMNSAGRRGSSILLQRPDEHAKNKGCSHCAVILNAELNLIDIVEDSMAVDRSLKSME